MAFVKSRSLNLSIMLHALAVLVAFVGLPAILPEKPDPAPLVMSVEILPITGVTNVKPSDKPIEREQKAPTLKTPKPVEPTVKEPPKPPTPTPAPPKPVTQPKEAAPQEKHFDPNEGAEEDDAEPLTKTKKEPPKPAEPPKPVEPPKKAEQPKADEFAALLNKLKQENTSTPAKDAKDKTNTQENKTRSDAPYDASLPLSLSERDAIRSQFIPCWRVPMGAKDAASLAVRVKVELLQDGTVKAAAIAPDQQSRYASDTYFRAAADSAVRAVHKCSPLKNLPADKFGTWKDMEINFDPRDML